jgi:hypothetical protein
MAISKNRINEFMLASKVMIGNASSDSVVKTALSRYGFNEEKLLAGEKLYGEAETLQILWKRASGEQAEATVELKSAWAMAKKQYMKALKIARAIFTDDPKAKEALMLQGDRKQDFAGWYEQAHLFYGNILDDSEWINVFAGYGYPREILERDYALVKQAETRSFGQKRAMGLARQAVEERDRKLAELARWIAELRAVAKVALEDDPQQLEKLGIVVRRVK